MLQIILYTLTILNLSCKNSNSTNHLSFSNGDKNTAELYSENIITGAAQTEKYLPLLKGKKVALVVNHTALINKTHLVDTLLSLGVQIKTIFAPEHSFRGDYDDGATVLDAIDSKTGIPIKSLYGKKKKPTPDDLAGIDVMIFNIQDVGTRFYTFLSTLHYIMESCAENNIPLLLLDRPNPNGHYVDGPVLKKGFESYVGLHPIPIVHGMTFGELAQMINGEGWLQNKVQCKLTIIPCLNYDHNTFYKLPVNPSPNLRNMESIFLYPSICLFEGTNVSVGRGTETPFQIIGTPYNQIASFSFVPKSSFGSSSPPFKDVTCYGYNLTTLTSEELAKEKFTLKYVLMMYDSFTDKSKFFLASGYFNKLAGNDELMQQIKAGLTEDEIRISWQDDLHNFKILRKKYLIYADFE